MAPVRHIDKTADDQNLMVAFQQTLDQNALAILYLRYNDLVFGTCMKYFKNEEVSRDAVMNIYQELVQKLPNHKVENFKS